MVRKDLLIKLHGYIASDGGIYTYKCKDLHGKKLRIRRRLRTKFFNKEISLIFDFMNSFKLAFPSLNSIKYYPKRFEVEVRNDLATKEILKLGKVHSSNWQIPKNITNKQKRIWIRAFADGEGTIYNKNYNRYIALDSINKEGLTDIGKILSELGIINRIYEVNFKSNTSFRLRIYRKANLVNFNNLIGFTHPGKQEKLSKAINSFKMSKIE